jgi:hypothetical protein
MKLTCRLHFLAAALVSPVAFTIAPLQEVPLPKHAAEVSASTSVHTMTKESGKAILDGTWMPPNIEMV